eukprot:SAG11_NODE_19863_length_457_cov_1.136872_1_plen_151_part_11
MARALHELMPEAVHLSVILPTASCSECAENALAVGQHYGIPVVNMLALGTEITFASLFRFPPELIGTPGFKPGSDAVKHPAWYIHQYMADVLAFAFRQQIKFVCDEIESVPVAGGSVATATDWPTSLVGESELSKLPVCLHPQETSLSAYD